MVYEKYAGGMRLRTLYIQIFPAALSAVHFHPVSQDKPFCKFRSPCIFPGQFQGTKSLPCPGSF